MTSSDIKKAARYKGGTELTRAKYSTLWEDFEDGTIKKIEINFTPGTIEFPSADRLKLYVNEMLEKTKGLVATDDSIKATKASRTQINKLEKSIADVRKRYKKAKMVDLGDGKLIDTVTGEVKQQLQQVSFTLRGTKDQLDNLARYCVQAGINVIKASDRETIIE